MKAVITAAGREHRHLPLQTVTDARGYPTSLLRVQIQELAAAGVDEIGIVVNPGDTELFRESAGDLADRLTFLPQEEPLGFGHAVALAEDFVSRDDFILSVGDHLFVSADPGRNCFQQVIEASRRLGGPVAALQPTRESEITRFGTVAGERVEGGSDTIRVERMIEKPTPTVAEQELFVSGLKAGFYYCFFGIHVLPAAFFPVLRHAIGAAPPDRPANLTDALSLWIAGHPLHGFAVSGRRFDLEARFGLLQAQIAMALNSRHRDEVLATVVDLVANPGR